MRKWAWRPEIKGHRMECYTNARFFTVVVVTFRFDHPDCCMPTFVALCPLKHNNNKKLGESRLIELSGLFCQIGDEKLTRKLAGLYVRCVIISIWPVWGYIGHGRRPRLYTYVPIYVFSFNNCVTLAFLIVSNRYL